MDTFSRVYGHEQDAWCRWNQARMTIGDMAVFLFQAPRDSKDSWTVSAVFRWSRANIIMIPSYVFIRSSVNMIYGVIWVIDRGIYRPSASYHWSQKRAKFSNMASSDSVEVPNCDYKISNLQRNTIVSG